MIGGRKSGVVKGDGGRRRLVGKDQEENMKGNERELGNERVNEMRTDVSWCSSSL